MLCLNHGKYLHQHKQNNLRGQNLSKELSMIIGTVGSKGMILQQMAMCLVKQDGWSSVPTTVDVKEIVH